MAFYRWTPSSIACYFRGCRCDGCEYNKFFKDKYYKCKMRDTVFELVRKLGAPTKEIVEALKGQKKEDDENEDTL